MQTKMFTILNTSTAPNTILLLQGFKNFSVAMFSGIPNLKSLHMFRSSSTIYVHQKGRINL